MLRPPNHGIVPQCTYLFAIDRRLGRLPYFVSSLAVFGSQHLIAFAIAWRLHLPLQSDLYFWIAPWRRLLEQSLSASWLLTVIAIALAAGWLLALLALRRTSDSVQNSVAACFVFLPFLQLIGIAVLTLVPDAAAMTAEANATNARRRGAYAATVNALFLSAALSVLAVGVYTLVFGTYGYGLFVGGPFLLGYVAAVLAKRRGLDEVQDAMHLALSAASLAMLGLSGYALEGILCIVMAAPLVYGVVLIGAALGYATTKRVPRSSTFSVAMLLPLLGADSIAPDHERYVSTDSIEVAASPEQVWVSVINMRPIPEAPPAPFRWGLAYPVSGSFNRWGEGAIRTGVFSTGVAQERVVQWQPPERLSFVVLSEPPVMHELSLYQNVHAPHVNGYFRTLDATFVLTRLRSGGTRLELITTHQLDLDPAVYWLPIAQWVTEINKSRVLRHFAAQAEAMAKDAGADRFEGQPDVELRHSEVEAAIHF